jgi:hypothetical protein
MESQETPIRSYHSKLELTDEQRYSRHLQASRAYYHEKVKPNRPEKTYKNAADGMSISSSLQYQRTWRQKNPEKYQEYQRQYREKVKKARTEEVTE